MDRVDDEAGLEHEGVRDHRIVVRIGVLDDVEVALNGPFGIDEEGPVRAETVAHLVSLHHGVGGDGHDLVYATFSSGSISTSSRCCSRYLGQNAPRDTTTTIGSAPFSSESLRLVPLWSRSS